MIKYSLSSSGQFVNISLLGATMKNTPFFAQNLRRRPGFSDCLV